jgi:L-ascorbate metabolism protein UlaG (beta-lactamase superfamily)
MFEVYSHYAAKGLKGHPMNKGGWKNFDFGRARVVSASHSSAFADGSNGGEPGGFVFDTPEGTLYFAGDTALTMEMHLIPMICRPLDAAILPIGSNFTMDYHDALIATDFLKCNRIIGCHYDTFPMIAIDHAAATQAFEDQSKELILMEIGSTIKV